MNTDLLPLLKRYFGYSTFRPKQEEIIRLVLAQRDVVAILPTGGGKSLCFQLPALARSGLTVVISPLIALMKDQVDGLLAAGVPAALLNSALSSEEARPMLRGLHQGQFRLLYVSPERAAAPGFADQLARWGANVIAVDEAHCISEWGHDFRPEYRQIAALREAIPGASMMALTATATERVREDVIRQLGLRDPGVFVASFNRPNLTYKVLPKARSFERMLAYLRARPREGGIVYCQARRTAEQVAAKLSAAGVRAAPYHAGLDAATRAANQEQFLRDEIRVVCATIAFGMGINKPNVRFVIHFDLPKNIEGYYQETGRAGRDGLPGECILFFSAGDRVKHARFIDEKPDPREREIARTQLEQMMHYAESSACRRVSLLGYFGETAGPENCGACDNCLTPKTTWDGTLSAQKFMSCVYRIHEHSGFGAGILHLCDVLCGAATEKIRKFGHHRLSTHGIGKEHGRSEWAAIGRELVRLGLLRQNAEKFNAVELTPAGLAALKSRARVTLTRVEAAPERAAREKKNARGDWDCDEILFEALRGVRRRLAEERGVPAYIVFGDVSLRSMAREYPLTGEEFGQIHGVGERKQAEFAGPFLQCIRDHLTRYPRGKFAKHDFLRG